MSCDGSPIDGEIIAPRQYTRGYPAAREKQREIIMIADEYRGVPHHARADQAAQRRSTVDDQRIVEQATSGDAENSDFAVALCRRTGGFERSPAD